MFGAPELTLVTTHEKKKICGEVCFGKTHFDRSGVKEDESEKRDGFIENRKPQKQKQIIENRNPVTRSIKNAF